MIQVLRFLSPVLVAISINRSKEQMSSEGIAPHISIPPASELRSSADTLLLSLCSKGSASIAQSA